MGLSIVHGEGFAPPTAAGNGTDTPERVPTVVWLSPIGYWSLSYRP